MLYCLYGVNTAVNNLDLEVMAHDSHEAVDKYIIIIH